MRVSSCLCEFDVSVVLTSAVDSAVLKALKIGLRLPASNRNTMKILRSKIGSSRTASGAFTLVEMLVSLTVCSFVFVSLYAGLSTSTNSLQRAREKLRATQILTEKLEVIRLYNWDQVNTPGFIPTTFTEFQYPSASTGTNTSTSTSSSMIRRGITYTGTISIGPAQVHPAYTNTMRKVTATVRWFSNGIANTNEMETLISEFGVQRYVY